MLGVEKTMVRCVAERRTRWAATTHVSYDAGCEESSVREGGCLIAVYEHKTGGLWISNGGHHTRAVASRLNALLTALRPDGPQVTTKQYTHYLTQGDDIQPFQGDWIAV